MEFVLVGAEGAFGEANRLDVMIITEQILDDLSARARASERLRYNLDLRNSAEDKSQRMLNALEPGTVMPIHRHNDTSETCVWSTFMTPRGG